MQHSIPFRAIRKTVVTVFLLLVFCSSFSSYFFRSAAPPGGYSGAGLETCTSCHAGNNHLCTSLGFVGEVCDGGFAEETVMPARLLYRADPSIPAAVVATAEPLAVALHAVNRLAPVAGDTALVTGCGMIGAPCDR